VYGDCPPVTFIEIPPVASPKHSTSVIVSTVAEITG